MCVHACNDGATLGRKGPWPPKFFGFVMSYPIYKIKINKNKKKTQVILLAPFSR